MTIHGRQDIPRPTFTSPTATPESHPASPNDGDKSLSTTEIALIGLVTFAVISIVSLALYLYRGYLSRRQGQALREEDARRRRERATTRALRAIKTGPGWDIRPEMNETVVKLVESDPKARTKLDELMPLAVCFKNSSDNDKTPTLLCEKQVDVAVFIAMPASAATTTTSFAIPEIAIAVTSITFSKTNVRRCLDTLL